MSLTVHADPRDAAPPRADDAPRRERAAMRQEVERLQCLVVEAGTELMRLRNETESLRVRLRDAEAAAAQAQELGTELATLSVAMLRLHETLEWNGLMSAIQEVVVNLVGSEDFVMYEMDEAAGLLVPVTGFGPRADDAPSIPLFEGRVGAAAASGAAIVGRGQAGENGEPLVAMPITLANRVTGVLAIHALVSHKPALTMADRTLLGHLAGHLATALRAARLHAAAARPSTRTGGA